MHEQGRHARVPRAVIEIGGERHAVEVYLGRRQKSTLRAKLSERCRRYDAVVVFANPVPRRMVQRLAAEYRWPNLLVRPIPKPPPLTGESALKSAQRRLCPHFPLLTGSERQRQPSNGVAISASSARIGASSPCIASTDASVLRRASISCQSSR